MTIGTRDIARMKAQAEAELSDTATIRRSVKIANGQGGHTSSYSDAGTFDCLLSPVKRQSDEDELADRNAKMVRRVLTYPTATSLLMTDRIVCQGATWDVAKMMEPRSINVVNRAELVRVS